MPVDTANLISEIKNGSQKAFRILVEQNQQYAFNLAFRILCNDEDAKDAVQDSFIKIWKNIHQFDPNRKFSTWMYKIVMNTTIDKQREIAKRSSAWLGEKKDIKHFAIEDVMVKKLENDNLAFLIHGITNQLPEKQKLVFILRDMQELSSAEVQDVMNLSENSVKSNLYIARRFVRQKLTQIINYERVSS